MIRRPRLKTYLTFFPITDTAWGVQGGSEELWRLQLDDESAVHAFGSLLPFLNGQHDVDDIVSRMSGQHVDSAVVQRLLAQLERSGFIAEAAPPDANGASMARFQEQIAFFSRFGKDEGVQLQSALKDWRVAVLGHSRLAHALVRQLGDAGFTDTVTLREDQETASNHTRPLDRRVIWQENGDEPAPRVLVLAQTAHDPGLLNALNAYSNRTSTPWMLVRCLDAHEGWVGPLFIPGETASYASLEARLRGNLPFFEEYRALNDHLEREGRASAACGGLHSVFELVSAIAVTELIKFATGVVVPRLAGSFLTINLLTWETEVHEVLRVPHLDHQTSSMSHVYPWKELAHGDKPTKRA